MSTGQDLSVIDEITEAGCLYLLITGGEPLLRNDFSRDLQPCKKMRAYSHHFYKWNIGHRQDR